MTTAVVVGPGVKREGRSEGRAGTWKRNVYHITRHTKKANAVKPTSSSNLKLYGDYNRTLGPNSSRNCLISKSNTSFDNEDEEEEEGGRGVNSTQRIQAL